MMNGMTGPGAGPLNRESDMNIKTSLFSALAALVLSTVAVGTAVVPGSVALASPSAIQNA